MLVLGVFGSGAVVLVLLAYLAGALAGYVPFSAERHLAAQFLAFPDSNGPLQRYLQHLADRLAKAEQLPPDMPITVHYVDDDTVNAIATLGGHVVFFRGLLERMPNENALAMVMAHEVAHVKTRAPLKSMGRGMIIATALTALDASLGTRLAGSLLDQAGLLSQLSFSRSQENQADSIGLAALVASYGGTAGADDLFRILGQVSRKRGRHVPELYRSHPDMVRRLASLHRQAQTHGWRNGSRTPLPAAFQTWLKTGRHVSPKSTPAGEHLGDAAGGEAVPGVLSISVRAPVARSWCSSPSYYPHRGKGRVSQLLASRALLRQSA